MRVVAVRSLGLKKVLVEHELVLSAVRSGVVVV
jgi:hypothetical protein